jgi:hypothetical protein
MILTAASFTDSSPSNFRMASSVMRLVPVAACFFAQRYKGREYLLRSLAGRNSTGSLLATVCGVWVCNNVFNSRIRSLKHGLGRLYASRIMKEANRGRSLPCEILLGTAYYCRIENSRDTFGGSRAPVSAPPPQGAPAT